MPDPAHRRKPRRAALYIPFIIAGVAAIGWSGLWLYARGEADKRLEAGAEQLRKAGYDVAWSSKRIYGYPFRLNIQLDDAKVREPSGWALAAPKLEAQAFMHGRRPGCWPRPRA